MNGLQAKYADSLQVVSLDFNDPKNGRAISDLGIRAHPTLAIIRKDGTLSRLWYGAPKEGELDQLIEAVIR